MNITITGKELKATEAIKDYAEKKLPRIEKYFGDEAIDVLEGDFLAMLKDSRELLSTAEDAKDQGTVDLMAGLISEYEKSLWMIKSYKA